MPPEIRVGSTQKSSIHIESCVSVCGCQGKRLNENSGWLNAIRVENCIKIQSGELGEHQHYCKGQIFIIESWVILGQHVQAEMYHFSGTD